MRVTYTLSGRGANGTPTTLFSGMTSGDMLFDTTANAITDVVKEFLHSDTAQSWTHLKLEITRFPNEVDAA